MQSLDDEQVRLVLASESARLNSLWTEIYADRWACHINNDLMATVAALIKTATGLSDVNAASYLQQADEIFAKEKVRADQITHPESFIRVRALRLWSEQGEAAEAEIERVIEGGLHLQRLDFLAQQRAADLTRDFLQSLLSPVWHRTEATLAHAKHFFPEFAADSTASADDRFQLEIERGDESLADYFCYLMLDFATVDRDLGDVALAAALVKSRRLGIDKRFTEIVQKELTLGKRAFAKLVKEAEAIVAKAEAAHPS